MSSDGQRFSAAPFALAMVLVLVIFVPNLPYFSTAAIGGADTDALKHVWTQWWVVHRLLQDGAIPMQATLIHHPTGGPFFALDTVNALIGLPLRAFMGPVATYNVVLLLDLILAAWAAVMLSRHIGADPWPSALVGVAWSACAWTLAFPLGSGVSETAMFFPIPLILLMALKMTGQRGWDAPIAFALLFALQGLGCWSHGITTGVIIAMGLGFWLVQRPWNWTRETRYRLDRQVVLRWAVAIVLLLLLMLPAYLAISGTVHDVDAVKTRYLSLFPSNPISPLAVPEANAFTIADFFLPGAWGLRVSDAGPERLMYSGYLGWLSIALGVFAWRKGQRSDRIIAWGTLLLLVLALGPRVFLDQGRSIGGVPNPFYLGFYYGFPLFNTTIHSVDRLVIGAQLGVALLAARGLTIALKSRVSGGRRLAFAAAVGVLLEAMVASPAPWPVPMVMATPHPSAVAIGAIPGTGAVLDLPFLTDPDPRQARFVGDIFLQQTTHRRPIPFQLEGMGAEALSDATRANPFYQAFSKALRSGRAPSGCDGAKGLAQLGFSHLIWRKNLVETAMEPTLQAHLQRCLGPGHTYGDRVVFEVGG
jgi:hypothetical protein